jgi:hypothetical protein
MVAPDPAHEDTKLQSARAAIAYIGPQAPIGSGGTLT